MPQLTLDLEAACQARDAGLAVAERAASDAWVAKVREVVRGMTGEFMAEDVRAKCVELGPEYVPASHKAWGMAFRKFAFEGLIEQIGWRKCRSKATHGHPAALWQLS